jgi:polysaccharide biosynthesis transport protein
MNHQLTLAENHTENGYVETEFHLRDLLGVLWKRRWLIFVGVFLPLIVAFYYVQTAQPIYQAKVILYYERHNPQSYLLENFHLGPQTLEIDAQKALLTSPYVLNQIIDRVQLDPFLSFTPEELETIQSGHLLNFTADSDSNLTTLTALATTPEKSQLLAKLAAEVFIEEKGRRKTSELSRALTYLQNQISTIERELGRAEEQLNQFRTKEGMFATPDSNSQVSGKVRYSLLNQLNELQKTYTSTQMQRALAESQLATLRAQIEEKRAQTDASDMRSIGSNSSMPPQIELYQKKVIELEVQLDSAESIYTDKSSEVIELRQQLESAKARLQQEWDALMKKGESLDPLNEWKTLMLEVVVQEINVQKLRRTEEFYENQIRGFNEQHPELVNKEVDLMRLERSARQYEETYAFLVQKQKETQLLKEMKSSDFEIYKPANLPERPIKPRKALTVLMALCLGFALSIGVASFLEYMDDSIKTREQIEGLLGIPVIATIPKIANKDRQIGRSLKRPEDLVGVSTVSPLVASEQGESTSTTGTEPPRIRYRRAYLKKLKQLQSRALFNLKPKSQATESYRQLRTNLQYTHADGFTPKVLLVTSAIPGEGKTLTTFNLAISLANMGARVLLVDCDLRRPRIHHFFGEPRDPGLSDILISDTFNDEKTVEEVERTPMIGLINEIDKDHLWKEHLKYVVCGSRVPNTSELIGSQRMGALLKYWRTRYDWILLDSTPVIPVVDSVVLAREADSLLMVVRAQHTAQRAVQQAHDVLAQTGVPFSGIILNSIDHSKVYGDYYYYRTYRQYYGEEDEN